MFKLALVVDNFEHCDIIKNMRKNINGNVSLAMGAISCGLDFYAGYPITPSTDILEYLSYNLDKNNNKIFIQSESEISAINMVFGAAATGKKAMTSTSGPGFSLIQEGISYMSADDIPCVIVNVMREGSGLGDIPRSQGDYFQMTKGGGNGDYKNIVLAPNSVDECFKFPKIAFDLAFKYRNPVIITYDADIGHMIENIEINKFLSSDDYNTDYSLRGCKNLSDKRTIQNVYYHNKNYNEYLNNKIKKIIDNEQKAEIINVSNADVVIVAYGIMSRIGLSIIDILKKENINVGLIRPISLFPFPTYAFKNLNKTKFILSFELSILGQMIEDIKLSVNNNIDVFKYGTMSTIPNEKDVVDFIKNKLRNY